MDTPTVYTIVSVKRPNFRFCVTDGQFTAECLKADFRVK